MKDLRPWTAPRMPRAQSHLVRETDLDKSGRWSSRPGLVSIFDARNRVPGVQIGKDYPLQISNFIDPRNGAGPSESAGSKARPGRETDFRTASLQPQSRCLEVIVESGSASSSGLGRHSALTASPALAPDLLTVLCSHWYSGCYL